MKDIVDYTGWYDCKKCGKSHLTLSKVGKEHRQFAKEKKLWGWGAL
jgi:hypothetical protein